MNLWLFVFHRSLPVQLTEVLLFLIYDRATFNRRCENDNKRKILKWWKCWWDKWFCTIAYGSRLGFCFCVSAIHFFSLFRSFFLSHFVWFAQQEMRDGCDAECRVDGTHQGIERRKMWKEQRWDNSCTSGMNSNSLQSRRRDNKRISNAVIHFITNLNVSTDFGAPNARSV